MVSYGRDGREADTPPDLQSVEWSAETARQFGEEKLQRRPASLTAGLPSRMRKKPQNRAIPGEQSPVSLAFTVP